jgi:dsRNA-specific ribonuclease
MSHLNHFCSLLGSGPYIDTRPQFSFTSAAERLDQEMSALISAEVTLPISVDQAMRKARSSQSWMTERMAKKDAAFQAYRILHLAGLVNDNLLPVRQEEDDLMQEFQIPDHTPSLVEVSPSFDPWQIVVQYQQQNPYTYHRIHLKIHTIGEDPFYLVLLVPCSMPPVAPFSLHWNNETQYSVESSWLPGTTFTEEELTTLRAITRTILFSIHHGRMKEERYDFLALLAPSDAENPIWTHTELHNFNVNANRYWSASDLIQQGDRRLSNWGLVSLQGDLRKYIVKGVSSETVEFSTGKSGHELQVIRVPRRRDFLHQIPEKTQESIAYTRIELFNATECVVDDLPTSYSILALFIPSILRTYEDYMIADTLRTTLMKPVSFEVSHLPLLLQALTSSTASSEHNYQRLEFLGDCILKFIASLHVMASHLKWPEGYLTAKKGKIVSNGYLARATMKAGLDQFVINKSFTGAKWTPRYVGDVLTQQPPKDKIMRSSKLLADVIESLIGASYVKGGFSDAFLCVQTLLTMETWTPIPEANLTLLNAASTDFRPTNLTILEELIGYKFIKKALLLEAVTHVSYTGPNVNCSYERLEFLGDAVLDYIVSKRLYAHVSPLGHPTSKCIPTLLTTLYTR